MEFEKYLPIGTVVLLKGGRKRIVICGYIVISKEDKKVYDYGGVLYPEGFINSKRLLLFNHEQIDKVYYYGLQDDEGEKFIDMIKKVDMKKGV